MAKAPSGKGATGKLQNSTKVSGNFDTLTGNPKGPNDSQPSVGQNRAGSVKLLKIVTPGDTATTRAVEKINSEVMKYRKETLVGGAGGSNDF